MFENQKVEVLSSEMEKQLSIQVPKWKIKTIPPSFCMELWAAVTAKQSNNHGITVRKHCSKMDSSKAWKTEHSLEHPRLYSCHFTCSSQTQSLKSRSWTFVFSTLVSYRHRKDLFFLYKAMKGIRSGLGSCKLTESLATSDSLSCCHWQQYSIPW